MRLADHGRLAIAWAVSGGIQAGRMLRGPIVSLSCSVKRTRGIEYCSGAPKSGHAFVVSDSACGVIGCRGTQ